MTTNYYTKSKDLVLIKNLSQEVVHDLSQQNVDVYRINESAVSYDSLYGEASNVSTNYYKWSGVYCFIDWVSRELAREKYGVDHAHVIECYFDYDYVAILDEDGEGLTNCLIREGDYIILEDKTFVVHLAIPVERVHGLENTPRTLKVECHSTRDRVFTE
jgi:hypothetical protein